MTTVLKTSSLGEIRGRTTDGVTKYLGIQYATLKNRFADAELVESRSGDVLDATNDGLVPQIHAKWMHADEMIARFHFLCQLGAILNWVTFSSSSPKRSLPCLRSTV